MCCVVVAVVVAGVLRSDVVAEALLVPWSWAVRDVVMEVVGRGAR